MRYTYLESPVGSLLLAGSMSGPKEALQVIGFPGGKMRVEPLAEWRRDDDAFPKARRQLTEYFNGKRDAFSLDLAPQGTEFQVEVWNALAQIPYGTTVSYRDIAEQIGRPAATRAVGAANGKNPLPIVLPCHRVVGADGSLTGFGGGLDTKRFLLELEGADIAGQTALEL